MKPEVIRQYDPVTQTLTINHKDFDIAAVYRHKGVYYLKTENHTCSFITDGERLLGTHTFLHGRPAFIRYKRSPKCIPSYYFLTLTDSLPRDECIKLYLAIAAPCIEGLEEYLNMKNFEDRLYTIQEVIDLTRGEYNSEIFEAYFTAEDDLSSFTVHTGAIPGMEPQYIPSTALAENMALGVI